MEHFPVRYVSHNQRLRGKNQEESKRRLKHMDWNIDQRSRLVKIYRKTKAWVSLDFLLNQSP